MAVPMKQQIIRNAWPSTARPGHALSTGTGTATPARSKPPVIPARSMVATTDPSAMRANGHALLKSGAVRDAWRVVRGYQPMKALARALNPLGRPRWLPDQLHMDLQVLRNDAIELRLDVFGR
jgi:hypothetical protein